MSRYLVAQPNLSPLAKNLLRKLLFWRTLAVTLLWAVVWLVVVLVVLRRDFSPSRGRRTSETSSTAPSSLAYPTPTALR